MAPSTTIEVMSDINSSATENRLDSIDMKKDNHMYYCVCGEISLILDCCINQLPLRFADNTRVLDGSKHSHIIASDIDQIMRMTFEYETVRKKRKIEYQYTFSCDRCGMPLFYKVDKKSEILFIMKKTLVAAKGEEPIVEIKDNIKVIDKRGQKAVGVGKKKADIAKKEVGAGEKKEGTGKKQVGSKNKRGRKRKVEEPVNGSLDKI